MIMPIAILFCIFYSLSTCDQLSRVGSWETLIRYSSRIGVSALDPVRAPRRVFCVQGYGSLVQYAASAVPGRFCRERQFAQAGATSLSHANRVSQYYP
jgi:hypothetical protein